MMERMNFGSLCIQGLGPKQCDNECKCVGVGREIIAFAQFTSCTIVASSTGSHGMQLVVVGGEAVALSQFTSLPIVKIISNTFKLKVLDYDSGKKHFTTDYDSSSTCTVYQCHGMYMPLAKPAKVLAQIAMDFTWCP